MVNKYEYEPGHGNGDIHGQKDTDTDIGAEKTDMTENYP
jgi:hypothetical protein